MNKFDRLRESMREQGIEGVLLTSMENMQWYSGFSGDTGEILVTAKKQYFMTDFRYMEMAERELGEQFECIKTKQDGLYHEAAELMRQHGIKSLGIETSKVTLDQKAAMDAAFDVEYISIDDKMHELRTIKTPEEIEKMRKGAKITADTFYHMTKIIKPGITEFDLLAEMLYFFHKSGVKPSFEPIIATGPNSSLPHATISNRKVQNGDFVTMDFGVIYGGVYTDFTRTVAVGGVAQELQMIYNIVQKAQIATLAVLRPGITGGEVDAAARDLITDAGYGAFYEHGTGHGVGVEIHEAPWFRRGNEQKLQAGMIGTVEPGIYLPGKGGVRIEDMVAITEDGYENFYTVSKDLIVL